MEYLVRPVSPTHLMPSEWESDTFLESKASMLDTVAKAIDCLGTDTRLLGTTLGPYMDTLEFECRDEDDARTFCRLVGELDLGFMGIHLRPWHDGGRHGRRPVVEVSSGQVEPLPFGACLPYMAQMATVKARLEETVEDSGASLGPVVIGADALTGDPVSLALSRHTPNLVVNGTGPQATAFVDAAVLSSVLSNPEGAVKMVAAATDADPMERWRALPRDVRVLDTDEAVGQVALEMDRRRRELGAFFEGFDEYNRGVSNDGLFHADTSKPITPIVLMVGRPSPEDTPKSERWVEDLLRIAETGSRMGVQVACITTELPVEAATRVGLESGTPSPDYLPSSNKTLPKGAAFVMTKEGAYQRGVAFAMATDRQFEAAVRWATSGLGNRPVFVRQ